MLLSIIVPAHNAESTIRSCIDSICRQDFADFEIVIIDDGSTDRTGEIADELARNDDRIVTIHQENRGVSGARNLGLECMKGKFFAFVDSDDVILNNIYQTAIEYMLQEDIDVLSFSYKAKYENGKEQSFVFKDENLTGKQYRNVIAYDDINYGGGFVWNKVISADYYKKHMEMFRLDIIFYEDKIWLLDVIDDFTRVKMISNVGYCYGVSEAKNPGYRAMETLKSFSCIAARMDLEQETIKKCVIRYGIDFSKTMKSAMATNDTDLAEYLFTMFAKEPVYVQQVINSILQNE